MQRSIFFFFNDTATTEIYTLSLHDALPISRLSDRSPWAMVMPPGSSFFARSWSTWIHCSSQVACEERDRKSTRLNSSHANISYAVFCLKKKKTETIQHRTAITGTYLKLTTD